MVEPRTILLFSSKETTMRIDVEDCSIRKWNAIDVTWRPQPLTYNTSGNNFGSTKNSGNIG